MPIHQPHLHIPQPHMQLRTEQRRVKPCSSPHVTLRGCRFSVDQDGLGWNIRTRISPGCAPPTPRPPEDAQLLGQGPPWVRAPRVAPLVSPRVSPPQQSSLRVFVALRQLCLTRHCIRNPGARAGLGCLQRVWILDGTLGGDAGDVGRETERALSPSPAAGCSPCSTAGDGDGDDGDGNSDGDGDGVPAAHPDPSALHSA